MGHFAQIGETGSVAQVVAANDDMGDWLAETLGGVWVQTSYNTRAGVHYTTNDDGIRVPSDDQSKALRFNYAGIGYSYDETRDAFIPPTPYASWVLDEDTCLWVAPVPMPDDGGIYTWDEDAGDWVAVEEPGA
jgi:hypothetical protein